MAVTTRVLRRGLEIFAGISLVGFIGLLLYGNNMDLFLDTMVSLKWGWLALGVLLASLDWLGGGIRIWILLRHLTERASLQGSILASGLSAWGAAVTPSQTGGGPMIIYTLHRYGTPVPEAMIVALMSFVATVIFYAIAGPTAIMLGAGRSLEAHGVLGQSVTLYDLFRLSLGGFIAIGVAMLFLFIFPGVVKRAAQSLVGWLEDRGSDRLAQRIRGVNSGIERSHECMVAFFKGWGWAALGAAVIVSAA
ncbi:MAG: lysylphosphatidylglycerol synthase transmembrane domain-containing protein, partial [Gemmatimonadales bacterium]